MSIKFLKIRDVKSPSRANEFDAGIDFYVPVFNTDFIAKLKTINKELFGVKDECCKSEECCSASYAAAWSGTMTLAIEKQSTQTVSYNLKDINDTQIKFDEETCTNYFLVPPHQRVLIPSGIKVRMSDPGRALIAGNKSGVATKHGLVFGAQVVDYEYEGEVHLSVINTSTKVVRIYERMKILQFVETPVFNSNIEVLDTTDGVTEEKFYKDFKSKRNSNGFGSTDKK